MAGGTSPPFISVKFKYVHAMRTLNVNDKSLLSMKGSPVHVVGGRHGKTRAGLDNSNERANWTPFCAKQLGPGPHSPKGHDAADSGEHCEVDRCGPVRLRRKPRVMVEAPCKPRRTERTNEEEGVRRTWPTQRRTIRAIKVLHKHSPIIIIYQHAGVLEDIQQQTKKGEHGPPTIQVRRLTNAPSEWKH